MHSEINNKQAELLLDDKFIETALRAVKDAKRRVWVTCYDWRWYENEPESTIQQFNSAVYIAKRRGVDVRAICDKRAITSNLQMQGIDARFLRTNKTLHTKAILIDDTALILGSHNLTKRGADQNFECSVLIKELEPILQFERYFQAMWQHLAAK